MNEYKILKDLISFNTVKAKYKEKYNNIFIDRHNKTIMYIKTTKSAKNSEKLRENLLTEIILPNIIALETS